MKNRKLSNQVKEQIGKDYEETNVTRLELSIKYKVCIKTISTIIKKYRDKQGIENEVH